MTTLGDHLTAAQRRVLELVSDQRPQPPALPPLEDRVTALEVTVDTIQQDLGETAAKA